MEHNANCIVLCNTIYTSVRWTSSKPTATTSSARTSGGHHLAYDHITLTGRYHLIIPELIRRGEQRPLKAPDPALAASA